MRSYDCRNSLYERNPRSIMSRMINRDHRSPRISTEAFNGHPERPFCAGLLLGHKLRVTHFYLQFTSQMGRLIFIRVRRIHKATKEIEMSTVRLLVGTKKAHLC